MENNQDQNAWNDVFNPNSYNPHQKTQRERMKELEAKQRQEQEEVDAFGKQFIDAVNERFKTDLQTDDQQEE